MNRAGQLPRFRLPASAEHRVTAVDLDTRWRGPGMAMEPEWSAADAFKWGLYANTFVYACVRANAEDVASLPFRAGGDPNHPADWNPESPLARLLGPPPGTPNVVTTAEQLFAWSVTQLRTAGRLAWEIQRDTSGRIVGFYPLPVHRVKPIPASSGESYWSGFKYDTGHRVRSLSVEEVFYHWRPSAHDWREPESPLQAARLDISVAVMQDRYDYSFLKNDARPAAVVVHEAFADRKDRDVWRAQFSDRHQGPENAGRIMFTETSPNGATPGQAIDVRTLGLSQRDAEFIQRYAAKVRAITVALGTPLTRIGDASGRTFSNGETEMGGYWGSTVNAIARDLAGAINMQLAPQLGTGRDVGWFDVSGVPSLQPPRRFTEVGVPSLVSGGLMTVNEGREFLGLPPIAGGDTLRPVPLDGGGLILPDGTVEPAEITRAVLAALDAAGVLLPPEGRQAPIQVIELADPATAVQAVQERSINVNQAQLDSLESRWTAAMTRFFDRQERETLKRLEGKRGRQATRATPDAAGVFEVGFWEAATVEVVSDLYEATVVAAGGNMAANVGLSFDLTAPWVQEFILSRANQLAGQITDTTYRAITEQLAAGVEAGESIPAIADRIRQLFQQTYASRAVTVARTEVISAYNGAAFETGLALGSDVIAGYEWLATLDERTRGAHAAAHGQIIAANGDDRFVIGGASMRYPGDPAGGAANVVRCRCTLLSLTPNEYDGRGNRSRIPLTDPVFTQLDQVLSGRRPR